MLLHPKRYRFAGRLRKSGQPLRCGRRRSFVPRVDCLEDRTVPSTLMVTTNADSGAGSLRAEIAAANAGDTIVFRSALAGETIALTGGELDITKNLMITGLGAGQLQIDGNMSSRVFAVSSGVTASVSQLTIADGLADQGGGIDNAGILTLSQCTLANNEAVGDSATSGVGGAILNELGAMLTITGCTFLHNQVVGGNAGLGNGGGIMNFGSTSIVDSTFQANTATGGNDGGNGYGAGGAIANQNGAILTVNASVFVNNQAVDGIGALAAGGAIDNEAGASLAVNSSVFTGNKALAAASFSLGGAILNAGAIIAVAGCSFHSNLSSGFIAGESGAIESQFGQATITDSNFVSNEALGSGPGGAAVAGAVRNFRGPMTLTNCAFTANLCIGGDGADGIHSFGQANGGAILNRVGNLTLNGCTLLNNLAHGGNGGNNNPDFAVGSAFGGGIFNFPFSTLTVTNSMLLGNQAIAGNSAAGFGAQADGGGIDNDLNSFLNLSNSLLVGNIARGGGGAAGFAGGDGIGGGLANLFSSSATVFNTVLSGNQAIGGDGGLGANGGLGLGGGIVNGHPRGLETVADSSALTLASSAVLGNLARGGHGGDGGTGGDGLGGGILMGLLDGSSAATMTSSGSLFAANQAIGGTGGANGNGGDGLGGGFYVASGDACLQNSSITLNSALGGSAGRHGNRGQGIGGGLYILSLAHVGATGASIFGNLASTSNNDVFGVIDPSC